MPRRYGAAYATLLKVVLTLPWPIDAGLAAFFYLLFHAMSDAPASPGRLDPLIRLSSEVLQYLMPAALLLSACTSLLKGTRSKP
jgi:hypothetical protein